ncbi:hypothetical protein QBC35DRAFT_468963 [Podospora australis]|uniref:Uncharacterized protein n=1 Tax=Podospora australis TaxID=1536484 RepID=A0AAN6X3A1_9PEZI|nr:hypothetical protein QBC35DRAFT_468963 [Podospora australis]
MGLRTYLTLSLHGYCRCHSMGLAWEFGSGGVQMTSPATWGYTIIPCRLYLTGTEEYGLSDAQPPGCTDVHCVPVITISSNYQPRMEICFLLQLFLSDKNSINYEAIKRRSFSCGGGCESCSDGLALILEAPRSHNGMLNKRTIPGGDGYFDFVSLPWLVLTWGPWCVLSVAETPRERLFKHLPQDFPGVGCQRLGEMNMSRGVVTFQDFGPVAVRTSRSRGRTWSIGVVLSIHVHHMLRNIDEMAGGVEIELTVPRDGR